MIEFKRMDELKTDAEYNDYIRKLKEDIDNVNWDNYYSQGFVIGIIVGMICGAGVAILIFLLNHK